MSVGPGDVEPGRGIDWARWVRAGGRGIAVVVAPRPGADGSVVVAEVRGAGGRVVWRVDRTRWAERPPRGVEAVRAVLDGEGDLAARWSASRADIEALAARLAEGGARLELGGTLNAVDVLDLPMLLLALGPLQPRRLSLRLAAAEAPHVGPGALHQALEASRHEARRLKCTLELVVDDPGTPVDADGAGPGTLWLADGLIYILGEPSLPAPADAADPAHTFTRAASLARLNAPGSLRVRWAGGGPT